VLSIPLFNVIQKKATANFAVAFDSVLIAGNRNCRRRLVHAAVIVIMAVTFVVLWFLSDQSITG
jgi:hypothetical protein